MAGEAPVLTPEQWVEFWHWFHSSWAACIGGREYDKQLWILMQRFLERVERSTTEGSAP